MTRNMLISRRDKIINSLYHSGFVRSEQDQLMGFKHINNMLRLRNKVRIAFKVNGDD